jgi:hypothetical protein
MGGRMHGNPRFLLNIIDSVERAGYAVRAINVSGI